ncbi:MAG: hypothetical protein HGA66_19545, partial [Holophaga sp.]|nr:hypothetical protein [Holophaga sp.]
MSGYLDAEPSSSAWTGEPSLRIWILSILITVILAGGLPFLSYFLRASTWLLWVTAILIIASFARKLPMRGLLWPLAPYLGWLILYFVWGSILVD